MLGHDDVSVNAKIVVLANSLQRVDKRATCARISELRLPVITTESQEVNLSSPVKAPQSPRHESMLLRARPICL
jgi:hypothetical protein